MRNIVDTQKVTVNGKQKTVTTLKPIATAVAEWKAQNGQGGGSSQSGNGVSQNGGNENQGGNDNQGGDGGDGGDGLTND